MSLADELLADLEENDDGELEAMIVDSTNNESNDFAVPLPVIPKEEEIKNVSIRELAKLRHSERLKRVNNFNNYIFNNRSCGLVILLVFSKDMSYKAKFLVLFHLYPLKIFLESLEIKSINFS